MTRHNFRTLDWVLISKNETVVDPMDFFSLVMAKREPDGRLLTLSLLVCLCFAELFQSQLTNPLFAC